MCVARIALPPCAPLSHTLLSLSVSLTGQKREPPHRRKRMIAGRVEDIQLVDFAADAVQLAVEVLDGGRVGVLEFAAQKARHQRRFADARGPAGEWKMCMWRLVDYERARKHVGCTKCACCELLSGARVLLCVCVKMPSSSSS